MISSRNNNYQINGGGSGSPQTQEAKKSFFIYPGITTENKNQRQRS